MPNKYDHSMLLSLCVCECLATVWSVGFLHLLRWLCWLFVEWSSDELADFTHSVQQSKTEHARLSAWTLHSFSLTRKHSVLI